MRIFLCAIAALLLLTACDQVSNQSAGSAEHHYTAGAGASQSKWLDQRDRVYQHRVFRAADGSDIRQAGLWQAGPGGDPEVVIITRDYANRVEGQADRQSVFTAALEGSASEQQVDGLPLKLIVSAERNRLCLATLSQSGVGTFAEEQVSISVWDGPAEPRQVELDSQALPVGFLDDDAVQLAAVGSFQLEGGLLAPGYSRGDTSYILRLPDLQIDLREGIYLLSPASDLAATATQSFDPAAPGSSTVNIAILPWPRGGRPSLSEFEFPLHVSYSPFAWQPQLDWVSDELLAALVFMPEQAAEGRRANFHGLFKLVTLNRNGALGLVEDHLNGDLPFHASGGLLFYTRRQSVGDGQRWEVWASSPDGMYKRQLWSSEDPVYISLEDADADSCLLLHVQSLEVTPGNVALESKLLALSLEPIEAADKTVDDAADSGALQAPTGAKPPPLALPDTN